MTPENGQRAVAAAFARRQAPGEAVAADAERVARACHEMALRFHDGGKLVVFGNGSGSTDSLHIAVEFVHPVIVGKRALPALSLTNDVATITGVTRDLGFEEVFAHQLRVLGAPKDIALGVSGDGQCRNVLRGLAAAAELGMLTVALTGGDGGPIAASPAVRHPFVVPGTDAMVVKEVQVTLYHILWELVHVFFEQPGVVEPSLMSGGW